MTRRVAGRALGYLLLAAASCWAAVASAELARLSPVLWPLVLPGLVLTGLPAAVGAVTATALLKGSRAAGPLALMFALTLAQAVAVTLLSPLPLTRRLFA